MKTFQKLVVFSLLSLIGISAAVNEAKASVEIDFDTYAAVAYSPSTGKFGYSWNWRSRGQAERVALSNCQESDAKVVGWVKAGWLVLAVGDDNSYGVGYAYGDGASSGDAKTDAREECKKHTSNPAGIKFKVCVCSGNYAPQVYK